MTLRHMRIFIAVCDLGSVTAAAERLFMAQSAASLAIKQLEDYYAQPLFNRVSNRLRVSDAGRDLYDYAVHIVKLFDEAESEMKNWEALGVLRVGASVTIGAHLLPSLVAAYRERCPGTQVRAVIDNSEAIEKRVLLGEIDLGLIAAPGANKRLIAVPFMSEPLVFICPPGHEWAGQTVSIAELTGAPLILREPGSAARDMLDSALKLNGEDVVPAWQSISTRPSSRRSRGGWACRCSPARWSRPT